MKVFTFSLWGKDKKYTIGACKNAHNINSNKLLTDYTAIFYVYDSVPLDIIKYLENQNAIVINRPGKGNWTGMFDRFYMASDSTVSILYSRDCDSRISNREIAAITEFEQSNKSFHIIRDHPWHTTEILGGMWGIKNDGLIKDWKQLIDSFNKENRWQTDQDFLKEVIYPIVKNDCLVHDEFFSYNLDIRIPFPTKRIYDEYIGSVVDGNGNRVEEHHAVLRKYLNI